MKEQLLDVINEYINIYHEDERLKQLIDYITKYKFEELTDWNNFDGHIVASGFIYDISTNKFLVIYHKDQKMYLYPGGHVDREDQNILSAAIREVKEETGINNFDEYKVSNNELVPFDIDIHKMPHNERLDLPEHYHYDFRYLFIVNNINDIKIDQEESSDYKWVSLEEIKSFHFGKITNKLEKIISNL